jgi:hypothetical protein
MDYGLFKLIEGEGKYLIKNLPFACSDCASLTFNAEAVAV